jgi:glycosyltransferase involved in cell wall biosynthesis
LRFGAGVKGKVISSLLHGLPCVLSKVASEGMNLVDGEHVLEGDTAEQIADAIVRLHEDPALWTRLADAGFAVASAEFSVHSVAEKMADMLVSIGLVVPIPLLPVTSVAPIAPAADASKVEVQ